MKPFPGMDPYLEASQFWLEFHNHLAAEITAALNQTLDPRYRARLTSYVAYETVAIGYTRQIQPDVMVWRVPSQADPAPTTVATIARAPAQSAVPMEVPQRHFGVEIVTTGTGQLVTVIEILSPSNKRPGHEDAEAHRRKRRDILSSPAHLMEIDLLRGGERPPLVRAVPAAPYYVVLSRVDCRPEVDVWPIQLADALPLVPVPLLEPDPDVLLDLGAVVASAYARGAFERDIDYRQPPPPPPLTSEESAWVEALLREQGRGEDRANGTG